MRLFQQGVKDGIEANDRFVVSNQDSLLVLIEEMKPVRKYPDKEWLIKLLSKIPGKSCEIFARNYVPPPRAVAPIRRSVMMDNSDNFWTGL